MRTLSYASFAVLTYSLLFTSTSFADDTLATPRVDEQSDTNLVPVSTAANFTDEMRKTIKREVMSQPGVLLDMANMTDNGYAWTNDVVWAGSSASLTETGTGSDLRSKSETSTQWYIAGFLFQRARYKGVWLQYAFTLSESNGEIANFRRWYGNETFR